LIEILKHSTRKRRTRKAYSKDVVVRENLSMRMDTRGEENPKSFCDVIGSHHTYNPFLALIGTNESVPIKHPSPIVNN